MADNNGKKSITLVAHWITIAVIVISNIVLLTVAIYSRPTEEKVEKMIQSEFQEHSYLGQRLKNIDSNIENIEEDIQELKKE